ncbi:transposase [Saccharothrix sp. Mg75]|uniref:transposase n=1 Tax=Saccharothrix sp. Mg75 TaxID=3445357 RepID=UPI003EED88E3
MADGLQAFRRLGDGGKKVAGRKRHIVVDSMGLLLAVSVTPASTQDRVAARGLRRLRDTAGKRATLVWADGGHRRRARDHERLCHHHEVMVRWAMIRITSRRLARHQ